LFRQGQPPNSTYLFKHALVQDAAYETLLREPRRALHARIAETLESQFPDIVETKPELLARHCTEANQIEKAAGLWGKAGLLSLTRSAYVEASTQLGRALTQIASLPGTAALRREQIKLQVALANALMQTKGYAALETNEAFDQARTLIERAEALGEPPEDPLLLFSILYGFWAVNYVAFDGDAVRDLARQFLALAERQKATFPRMLGNRIMGISLFVTGDIAAGRAYLDQAIALYDPAEHRPLATRFGQDVGMTILAFRALALWTLGYPDAALADSQHSLKNARETSQAATLMFALNYAGWMHICRRNQMEATARAQELIALAEEKSAVFWKAFGKMLQGSGLAMICHALEAIDMSTAGLAAFRATGAKAIIPLNLLYLTRAYAELDQFDDAWRCMCEALTLVEATKERWYEAVVHRTAGDIALMAPQPDVAKAEAYFEKALAVARKQQAKSWELRAAMSMARLKRDQGKRDEARNLLAPVYGWFTEGFDTLHLKEAKALLEELEGNA
jgi:predicted ATPase